MPKKSYYVPISELSEEARQRRRERRKEYYSKNKIKLQEYSRNYYQANKDKYRRYSAEYHKAHPYKKMYELTPEQVEKRRAYKRAAYLKSKATGWLSKKKNVSQMTKTEIEIRKCGQKISYYKKRMETLKNRLAKEHHLKISSKISEKLENVDQETLKKIYQLIGLS